MPGTPNRNETATPEEARAELDALDLRVRRYLAGLAGAQWIGDRVQDELDERARKQLASVIGEPEASGQPGVLLEHVPPYGPASDRSLYIVQPSERYLLLVHALLAGATIRWATAAEMRETQYSGSPFRAC